MRSLVCLGLSVAISFVCSSCEKKQDAGVQSAEPAASVDKSAAIDPALAKAVAAASGGARSPSSPSAPGGPPSSGVFGPGAADREIRRGAAPKLTLGGQGSEPRVTLGSAQPKPGWKTNGNIQVTLRNDPQQPGLPVEFTVALEAQKLKPVEADGGSIETSSEGAVQMTARVKAARVGVAGVPAEVSARVAGLKGARVDYQVAPDGSGSGYRYELPGITGELRDYLRVLSDTLALVTLPMPKVPIGQGAYWMATSRDGVFGLDLVTYRLVKVESVSGNSVSLSVGTKRYATSNQFDLEGLPADAPRDLVEFEAKSEGRLDMQAGTPFPTTGDIQSLLAASLGLGEGQQQRGMLQMQSRVGLAFPAK